jgi:methylmalonyl-CoA decarboxylase
MAVVPLRIMTRFGSGANATLELTSVIATTSPLAHRILKEEVRVLANPHPLTPEAYERVQALRREAYDSDDYREGISAFMERREPVFAGK